MLQSELDAQLNQLKQEYEAKLADLKATYPTVIARQLAEGLLKAVPQIGPMIAASGFVMPSTTSVAQPPSSVTGTVTPAVETTTAVAAPVVSIPVVEKATQVKVETPTVAVAASADDSAALIIEPYIESERCTTCNECTNVNKKMFAYNADKQAYIKDAKSGTFAQLVQAAEKCPVSAIHPGTPLNPKEKDLEKWLERARAF
jgi:pyruvate-ferredoxin/flavodoxin oxidoreductase